MVGSFITKTKKALEGVFAYICGSMEDIKEDSDICDVRGALDLFKQKSENLERLMGTEFEDQAYQEKCEAAEKLESALRKARG